LARYAKTDGSGVVTRLAARSELLIFAVGANGLPCIEGGSGALDVKRVGLAILRGLGCDFLPLDWFQVFHGFDLSPFWISVLHSAIIAYAARYVKAAKPAMSCKLCRMKALRGKNYVRNML